MGVIYLVRHGQASFGAADYDVLSELGRVQAETVGAELRRREVDPQLVACGTLRRQRDTAVAALPQRKPRIDERWNEYDAEALVRRYAEEGVDRKPGPTQEELEHSLGRWGDETGDGSWHEFRQRIDDVLHELRGELAKGAAAVVFTSGGVISAVAASILGLDVRGFITLNRVIANGSITKVVVGRSGANLMCFNDHAHFEGPARELLSYR